MKPNDEPTSTEEVLPTWDVTLPPAAETVPLSEAIPVAEPDPALPVAQPVEDASPAPPEIPAEPASPGQSEPAAEATPPAEPVEESTPSHVVEAPKAPEPILCPVCGTARKGDDASCSDCGYYYSPADLARSAARPEATTNPEVPAVRLKTRFEILEPLGAREGVNRYRGLDHGDGSARPTPVVIIRQQLPKLADTLSAEEVAAATTQEASEEILPVFDDILPTATPVTDALGAQPLWPSLEWEQALLTNLQHPGLPAVLDRFTEDGFDYLVEEMPAGRSLWDAWDDPEADSARRFGYLADLAEILRHLHRGNALIEGLRPNIVVITPDERVRLADLGDLLPLPLPADVPLQHTFYTAPELLTGQADARADLYSFGAMLYALHVGRDLNEVDFDRTGSPKPFLPRFPDIHPAFGRLMMKTFRREVEGRFPTDEAGKEDPTGFVELIRTLNVLGRTLDNARLEIAAWTTTGMVRTGNEDAFALLHSCESRQDDLGEAALVLLCDGMGGYEAGEVAAALAIQVMRQYLVQQKPFAPLAGASPFATDVLGGRPPHPSPPPQGGREKAPSPAGLPAHTQQGEGWGGVGHAAPPIDVEAMKQTLKAALKEANKQVYAASRAPGSKRRGMGCTAEAVYVDGRNVVVGHVGDSRTYHLHEGRLIQLTRDQTLVNRLVELGTLTPEEAETHPRRNELQQAVGGQPDVEPGLYHGVLKAGDWVVVCSDGLSNHVTNEDLQQMLQGEGYSAETVARRLVNLANLQGATDNATVVVIRAT
jgi:protein phosphatase